MRWCHAAIDDNFIRFSILKSSSLLLKLPRDSSVTINHKIPYHITGTGIISQNGPAQLKTSSNKLTDQH